MRIGLFGGTFNPPHLAHLRLAKTAAAAAGLDKVIIMPTYLPPHKTAPSLLNGDDRLELCRRTFKDDFFTCSDYELRKGGKSYTVETLRHLQALYPDDVLYLIIGSDMLLSFHLWYQWREILSMARLVVLTREESVTRETLCVYAKETLGLFEEQGDVLILNVPPQDLSSTQIRAMLSNGEDASAFLTPDAYDYILAKGFYQ